jgi:dephospho-CoA kinase
MADDVVTNSGQLQHLREQVDALHASYVNFARQKQGSTPPLAR